MKPRNNLSFEEVSELLRYNYKTGVIKWRVNRGSVKAGDVAGSISPNGYIFIMVKGFRRSAHRLAWLLYYGVWPTSQIDHKNGVRTANWILNLREATHAQNCRNSKIQRNNLTGFKGVRKRKSGNYQAIIYHNGKTISLGTRPTPELASELYCKKADELFGEFSNHG